MLLFFFHHHRLFNWDVQINTNLKGSTVIWPQKNRDIITNSRFVCGGSAYFMVLKALVIVSTNLQHTRHAGLTLKSIILPEESHLMSHLISMFVWLSLWRDHDLFASLLTSFGLKEKSLSTEITPKHVIEIVMLCRVRKIFSCLENVSSVTQMCFSKPWNFLLWKYVESTEFSKKIIIPWIWLCWKSTQKLQSCFFINVLKFSWSLSCEDIMNWRTVVPELMQTWSSKEWESAQRWKNVPTCLLSLVFRIWKVIFKICIDHYL